MHRLLWLLLWTVVQGGRLQALVPLVERRLRLLLVLMVVLLELLVSDLEELSVGRGWLGSSDREKAQAVGYSEGVDGRGLYGMIRRHLLPLRRDLALWRLKAIGLMLLHLTSHCWHRPQSLIDCHWLHCKRLLH